MEMSNVQYKEDWTYLEKKEKKKDIRYIIQYECLESNVLHFLSIEIRFMSQVNFDFSIFSSEEHVPAGKSQAG